MALRWWFINRFRRLRQAIRPGAESSAAERGRKRRAALESLERRELLAYTGTVTPGPVVSLVTDGTPTALAITVVGGNLQHNAGTVLNTSGPDDWSSVPPNAGPSGAVPASPSSTIAITPAPGDTLNLAADTLADIEINGVKVQNQNVAPTIGAFTTFTAVQGQSLNNQPVATFSDPNGQAATDFSAQITWGDGSPAEAGTVVAGPGAGQYTVESTHTFHTSGGFQPSVSILDNGGTGNLTVSTVPVTVALDAIAAPVTAQAPTVTATVGAATITAQGATINGTAGAPLTNVVVATFSIDDPQATVAQFGNPQIDWGDGTVDTGTVQLVGRSPTQSFFQVVGSHTYALPKTYLTRVTITTPDNTIVNVPGAAVIGVAVPTLDTTFVPDKPTVVLGTPVGPLKVARLLPPAGQTLNPNLYTAYVDFGDGTGPQLATILADGTILAPAHTFVTSQAGAFPISVTVRDSQGVTVIPTTVVDPLPIAATSFAPLFDTLAASPYVEDRAIVNQPVAQLNITEPGGALPPTTDATFYDATIDWGDGTSPSVGSVSFVNPNTLQILGSHTYKESSINQLGGAYALQISVGTSAHPVLFTTQPGGVPLAVHDIAIRAFDTPGEPNNLPPDPLVPPVPQPDPYFWALWGSLDPSSDSGVSHTDGITNVRQPTFEGHSEPLSNITVLVDGASVGTTTADASGAWKFTTPVALADGKHEVRASAVDRNGVTISTDAAGAPASALLANLVIDTVGPKITRLAFDTTTGRIKATFLDNLSGMAASTIIDNRNFQLSKLHERPGSTLFTSLTAAPPAADGSITVTGVVNNGKPLKGGTYTLKISDGPLGITDVAGNPLDGEFYGYFPSGNNVPGGNFVAILDTVHHLIYSPKPSKGYASPLPAPGTLGSAFYLFNRRTPPIEIGPRFTRPLPPGFSNPPLAASLPRVFHVAFPAHLAHPRAAALKAHPAVARH
jgi:hypothetical protein